MKFTEKLPSKLELMPGFISKVIEEIKTLNISDDKLFDIRLSLEEALINAIKYGNKMNPQLFVELSLEVQDNKLIIKIKDEGEGFDFMSIPNPTDENNLEKNSGRGVFLVKSLMDEVEFLDNGSQIKMVKVLR